MKAADASAPFAYRILADPYNKRISIERYRFGRFDGLIYDSLFLDFRTLTERDQKAWSQEELPQDDSRLTILVRDMNERVLYLEENHFNEEGRCIRCDIKTPNGWLLASNHILEDGVELYDCAGKLVGKKKYAVDENGVFRDLLEVEGLP